MSDHEERTEDAERVTADAPAEGAESPGEDGTETTPHPQAPAEGVDVSDSQQG